MARVIARVIGVRVTVRIKTKIAGFLRIQPRGVVVGQLGSDSSIAIFARGPKVTSVEARCYAVR